jgi:SAM-dependent methyltransferase
MHPESAAYVESIRARFPEKFCGQRVLEVGSLDINGSMRRFFEDCDYLGIDLGPGTGVDRVVAAHELIEPEFYDVVICSEALEHDRHWKRSLEQMWANLKSGGLFVLTCAGPARREHGTTRQDPVSSPFTLDYYRNLSVTDVRDVLPSLMIIGEIVEGRQGQDVYGYGVKL